MNAEDYARRFAADDELGRPEALRPVVVRDVLREGRGRLRGQRTPRGVPLREIDRPLEELRFLSNCAFVEIDVERLERLPVERITSRQDASHRDTVQIVAVIGTLAHQ